MTSKQIRQEFLDFFKSKEHQIVPSAPVIPHGDKALMFTNAGMNQFADVFLGTGTRDYKRATDTQKCVRVSGKHNDLEEVGVDTYHHTFFEMLGNWSLGDYYKKEAIAWAWELLTDVWKLDKDRLFITVFETDDEAYELWTKHVSQDRIIRCGAKDNFWEMGAVGPCGPCSEIHYDGTPGKSGKDLVNEDHPDVIEIWNLVFIQSNRKANGSLEDLSAKHIDTGMGLERIVRVMQNKSSNYDTDIFMPLIDKIAELSGKVYGENEQDDIAMRVIADHVRMVAFSVADGALPSSDGRGYVIRRVLRRALRFARNLGLKDSVIYKLVAVLKDQFSDIFPEIEKQYDMVCKIIKGEEESFLKTLEIGLERLDVIISNMVENDNKIISGSDAFLLYDSFGFPLDLTALIGRERGFSVDEARFDKLMEEQKERSRASSKVTHTEATNIKFDFVTEFTGYDELETKSKILHAKGNEIILEKTPFYVEKGGQSSDTGTLRVGEMEFNVEEMRMSGESIIHIVKEEISENNKITEQMVIAKVDRTRRLDIIRNHSATHLMHQALSQVLGSHIQQQGSFVGADYLRFDFNHFEKVSQSDIQKIEIIVNKKIFEAIDVNTKEISIKEAQENEKIKMFFGDKYGSRVRAVSIDDYSVELCGGTHVPNTAHIGQFIITSESSVASGVRRIEAITGRAVSDYISGLNKKIIKTDEEKQNLNKEIKTLEKEITGLKSQDLAGGFDEMLADATMFGDIRIVTREIDTPDMDTLRDTASDLRDKLNTNGIALLAKIEGEKVQLACIVTDDLKGKYPAGKLVGLAAKFLGGGGGGKPHLATAGGRDASKLAELLDSEFMNIITDF
jgi:alanyl-tRNA synthetase